jgi:hypothetical protein
VREVTQLIVYCHPRQRKAGNGIYLTSSVMDSLPLRYAPAGNDTEGSTTLSSPAVRRTGKGIHDQAERHDPLLSLTLAGDDS